MPLNVGNLVPASLKSKEVATQEYVDNGILNSGYVTSEAVQEAIANDTTTIDGSRITTGSIDASLIKTGVIKSSGLDSTISGVGETIMDKKGIRVYDNNGILRVKIGEL